MRTFTRTAVLLALVALSLAPAARADDKSKLDRKLQDATQVYQELMQTPDKAVPQALLDKCRCVAVIPHVYKGALGWGARYGKGVMSCRNEQGEWSAPSFVILEGLSGGLQIGFESTDLVLFFMTDRGARSLMEGSKISLGGRASVAAGPLGRSGEASTDLRLNAEIYSYAKSKGLFAGLSLEGARLAPDKDDNRAYYGPNATAKALLFDRSVPGTSDAAQAFLRVLPTPA